MKSTGQHKTHKIKDQNLPCDFPGCDRHFQTPQALYGHRRMIHHQYQDKTVPEPDPKDQASPETIKNLESEVKRLELESKARKLRAELPTASARLPDIMEQSGLGSLEGESKVLAQKRAMGVGQQQPGWVDKLLANPEAVKAGIAGLKGILGVDHNNSGDNMATLLQSMGFSLKDLITQATAPKSGALEIAGMNLSGASLTPQLLSSLLDYKAKTEAAEKEYQGKKEMSDTFKSLLHTIGEGIGSGAIQLSKPGLGRNSGDISEQYMPGPEPVGFAPFTCPKCQTENTIPAEAQPGMKIKCQGEGCEEVYTVIDLAQQKPEREKKRKEVKIEEPPTSIPCENCGQMINIKNMALGSELTCPICQNTQTLMSPDIAVDPELPESEKRSQAFLR